MKTLYTSIIAVGTACILLQTFVMAQPCNGRFQQATFSSSVIRNIKYGSAPDYQAVMTDLLLDVYQPQNDTMQARPLVILVHGGGFKSGGKAGESMQTWGNSFASRGYVCASVDYRLGVTDNSDATVMFEASMRAVQDVKAAVRFFRKEQTTYKVDTSQIFLVGTSAGGLTVVHCAYLQDMEIPAYVDKTDLGSVEGNSGNAGYSSMVHGVISCWGAIVDTTWMGDEKIPLAAVHGTDDNTVPYSFGNSKFGFPLYGGASLVQRATSLGLPTALCTFYNAGHTLDGDMQKLDSCYDFMVDYLYSLLRCNQNLSSAEETDEIATTLSLSPNPSGNSMNLRIKASPISQQEVIIVNQIGQVVYRSSITDSFSTLDISTIPSGVYLLRCNGQCRMFVKE